MSIETFIVRVIAGEQIKDKVERDTLLTLCAFADIVQVHFKSDTLKGTLKNMDREMDYGFILAVVVVAVLFFWLL